MDIILVDTSGITAGEDLGDELLAGLGAAIAASVADVTEELEAEGLIPKATPGSEAASAPEGADAGTEPPVADGPDIPEASPTPEAVPEGTTDPEAVATDEDEPLDEELAAFEASVAASVAGSIAALGLDGDGEGEGEEEGDAPPLYSPKGKEHLYRLFDWLLYHGQPFRIIGCLPEVGPGMRDWFSEMLFEIRMKYEAATLMVVEADHCTEETLERLFDLGFRSLIVHDDGSLDHDELAERIAAMERFHRRQYTDSEGGNRTPRQSELVCWGLWLDAGNRPDNYRRLRKYQDSVIPWDEVTGPQFQQGRGGETVPASPDAPGGYLPGALPCRLFENSVTIDTTGAVLHCPRYCHHEGGVSANLFQHAPEEIFVHKGAAALSVGCTGRCLDCGVGGRYFWPEDAINLVREFMALGKTEQGVAAYTPPAEAARPAADFDLAAADPETQERELAQFEESLGEWAASMEAWDDNDESS